MCSCGPHRQPRGRSGVALGWPSAACTCSARSTRTRSREAIERPATNVGYRVESGLTELLTAEIDGEAGALPMLSHALVETWRRRDGTVLSVHGYLATGVFGRDRPIRGRPLRPIARRRPGGGAIAATASRRFNDRRRPDSLSRRHQHPAGDPRRERVLAALVRACLVTADAGSVALAHEALAREWPRLRSWLDDDTDGQRMLRHLAVAAAEWDTLGRPDSELYRGARLDATTAWWTSREPDLIALEEAFLIRSSEVAQAERDDAAASARREARQNRRLRRAVIGLAVFGAGRDRCGVSAVQQGRRADARTSRRRPLATLATTSEALRSSHPDLAALLAVEANLIAPNAATQSSLLGLFTASPSAGPTHRFDTDTFVDNQIVVVGDDGASIAGVGVDGVVRIVDVATGDVVRELRDGEQPTSKVALAKSADGSRLVVARQDGGRECKAQRSRSGIRTQASSSLVACLYRTASMRSRSMKPTHNLPSVSKATEGSNSSAPPAANRPQRSTPSPNHAPGRRSTTLSRSHTSMRWDSSSALAPDESDSSTPPPAP